MVIASGDSMRSRTLLFLVALVGYSGGNSSAQISTRDTAWFVLVGRVTDTSGAPIPRAQVVVLVDGSPGPFTRSDSAGSFRLDGLSPGAVSILVRRLGYRGRVFSIEIDGHTKPLDAVLTPAPVGLGSVRVQAKVDESKRKLREFYDHRQHGQLGYFFDTDDILKRRPLNPSDLLRAVPGVRLVAQTPSGSQVRVRGCRPTLWIDGVRRPNAELDETVSTDDIAAVEVYKSLAGIPAQFMDRETNCGAIVVWTRS
jgi:hypothetical protein